MHAAHDRVGRDATDCRRPAIIAGRHPRIATGDARRIAAQRRVAIDAVVERRRGRVHRPGVGPHAGRRVEATIGRRVGQRAGMHAARDRVGAGAGHRRRPAVIAGRYARIATGDARRVAAQSRVARRAVVERRRGGVLNPGEGLRAGRCVAAGIRGRVGPRLRTVAAAGSNRSQGRSDHRRPAVVRRRGRARCRHSGRIAAQARARRTEREDRRGRVLRPGVGDGARSRGVPAGVSGRERERLTLLAARACHRAGHTVEDGSRIAAIGHRHQRLGICARWGRRIAAQRNAGSRTAINRWSRRAWIHSDVDDILLIFRSAGHRGIHLNLELVASNSEQQSC